jgi:hypothetical protein
MSRLTVLALLALSSAATAQGVRPILCDRNVVFVLRADGTFWPELAPPDRYVVELRVQGASREKVAATAGDPTYLKAAFSSPLPAGADLGVVVHGAGGAIVGEAPLSTKPKATIQPSGAAAEAHFRFEVDSSTPLAPLPPERRDSIVLVEVRHRELVGADGAPIPEEVIEHKIDLFREPVAGCAAARPSSMIVDFQHDRRSAAR